MNKPRAILAGAAAGLAARALLVAGFRLKLRRDVARLSAGDHRSLLAGYAEDAVLHFTDGDHRWAGTHRGRAAIDRFLREMTNASITGQIVDVWISGWPWSMQLLVRFDDEALGPGGEQLYANRTALWARTRWGKIVEQRDFYEDTSRIEAFEGRLRELGIEPVGE